MSGAAAGSAVAVARQRKSKNKEKEERLEKFCMSLRKDATKTNVNLSNGVLNDGWVARIAMLMPRNVTMHKVDMSGNGLGLRSAEAISGALTAKHSSLTSLSSADFGAAESRPCRFYSQKRYGGIFRHQLGQHDGQWGQHGRGHKLASALEEAKG